MCKVASDVTPVKCIYYIHIQYAVMTVPQRESLRVFWFDKLIHRVKWRDFAGDNGILSFDIL